MTDVAQSPSGVHVMVPVRPLYPLVAKMAARSASRGMLSVPLSSIATFGASYALVIVVEPLLDLGVLAMAKSLRGVFDGAFVTRRLHHAEGLA